MSNQEVRDTAAQYAVRELGWSADTRAIGCLPDPKVEGTFMVAVEGDVDEKKCARMALLVCNGQVTSETDISDFVSNGGVLDDPKAQEEPVKNVSFHLGPIVATPGAIEAFQRNNTNGFDLLSRHARGDWGELCDEDKQANDAALQTGARLLSAYHLPDGTKIWLITDAEIDDQHHRQASTFLLPDEY